MAPSFNMNIKVNSGDSINHRGLSRGSNPGNEQFFILGMLLLLRMWADVGLGSMFRGFRLLHTNQLTASRSLVPNRLLPCLSLLSCL